MTINQETTIGNSAFISNADIGHDFGDFSEDIILYTSDLGDGLKRDFELGCLREWL